MDYNILHGWVFKDGKINVWSRRDEGRSSFDDKPGKDNKYKQSVAHSDNNLSTKKTSNQLFSSTLPVPFAFG